MIRPTIPTNTPQCPSTMQITLEQLHAMLADHSLAVSECSTEGKSLASFMEALNQHIAKPPPTKTKLTCKPIIRSKKLTYKPIIKRWKNYISANGKSMYFPQELNNALRANGYKDSSIKTLSGSIKRIMKLINPSGSHTKFTESELTGLMNNQEQVLSVLFREVENINSRTSILNAIIKVLSADGRSSLDEYNKAFGILSKHKTATNQYKQPTLAEEDAFMEMKDIRAMQASMAIEMERMLGSVPDVYSLSLPQKRLYLKFVVLSLYALMPPLRGEEYFKSVVIFIDEREDPETLLDLVEMNFYDMNSHRLFIRYYKTQSTYGTRVIDMHPDLKETLSNWVAMNPATWLIPNLVTQDAMSQQGFTSLLNSIFAPKKISSSMLRKIFVSDFISNKPTADERKKVAHIMGHSLQTQEFTYKRFT